LTAQLLFFHTPMSAGPTIRVTQVAANSTLPPEAAAPAAPGGVGSAGAGKRTTREKVALTPGHSPLDWTRLVNSGKDLAGNQGRLRAITAGEVRQHRKLDDCWMIIKGRVYNVTPYMLFHPGGEKELMKGAGKDATKLFDEIHAWVNVEAMLKSCLLGVLKTDESSSESSD
jgi:cytochrome b involved in lipid metabolism